jgi:hypothetical protein
MEDIIEGTPVTLNFPLTPLVRTKAELCLQRMDWDRIHQVMIALDWKWGQKDTVPGPGEIEQFAYKLLLDAWQYSAKHEEGYTYGSGGFEVQWWEYDGNCDCLLKFVVYSADSISYF